MAVVVAVEKVKGCRSVIRGVPGGPRDSPPDDRIVLRPAPPASQPLFSPVKSCFVSARIRPFCPVGTE